MNKNESGASGRPSPIVSDGYGVGDGPGSPRNERPRAGLAATTGTAAMIFGKRKRLSPEAKAEIREMEKLSARYPEAWKYGGHIANVMVQHEPEYFASLAAMDEGESFRHLGQFAHSVLEPIGAANLAWASSPLGDHPENYDAFAHAFRLRLLTRVNEIRKKGQ